MKIIDSSLHGTWTHQGCSHHVDMHDPAKVVEAYNPGLVVGLNQFHQLNEYNYRDLAKLIDGGFLSQKIRADELKRVEFDYIDDQGIVNFLVPSSEYDTNGIKYRNQVRFLEWDQVGQDSGFKDSVEKSRILLWQGNIQLHCTCPSFLYWGYQWILTVLDASIYPEEREPRVRNKKHSGVCCKHLNRVLRVLPFYSGRMASALKSQFG